jgi:hypothetical protein
MAAAKLVWTQFLPKVARRGLRGVKGDWDLPRNPPCGADAVQQDRARCFKQDFLRGAGFIRPTRKQTPDWRENRRRQLTGKPGGSGVAVPTGSWL